MSTPSKAISEAWTQWEQTIKGRCADVCAEYIRKDAREWKDMGGGSFRCCSPLRPDKNPSFQIWPDGGWIDWGTHETGDLISYIRLKDRCGYREALDVVAQYLALPTWEQTKAARPRGEYSEAAIQKALEWEEERRAVHECLSSIVHLCNSALGTKVREHLKRNYRLTDEFIDFEKIGWCPSGLYEMCLEHLPYKPAILAKTGMFTRHNEPAFAHRIVFPYWRDGICEYAIGREFNAGAPHDAVTIPEWDKGKYKKLLTHNDKHRHVSPTVSNEVFWGEDSVRSNKGNRDTLYITEGVTDAMMLKLLGLDTVSPVTTSFSNRQISRGLVLARGYKRVVIINDNEESGSGDRGARRMALILWADGINVVIGTLPLPDGKTKIDVNEYAGEILETHGEAAARSAIEAVAQSAVSLPVFLVGAIPEGLSHKDMEDKLKEIGYSSVHMTALQRADLWEKVLARFPRLPKKDAKKVFTSAYAEEDRRQKQHKQKEDALASENEEAHARADGSAEAEKRRQVFDEFGSYEAELIDGTRVAVTNFSLDLVRVIEQEDGPDLLAARVTAKDYTVLVPEWVIPSKAWEGRRSFVSCLPHVQMVTTLTDDEVAAVHELLAGNGTGHVPHIRGVRTIGWHLVQAPPHTDPNGPRGERQRFVLPAGTLHEGGRWMPVPDVIFRPDGGSNLQERLPRVQEDLDAPDLVPIARKALPLLFEMSQMDSALVLAGWHAAVAFKPWLREHTKGGFPLLGLQGSPGSGKSSLIRDIYWPLFAGVVFGDPMSCTSSTFSQTRDAASCNALMLWFDEFQPLEMGNSIVWFRRYMKRTYSGESEARGRADQSLMVYRLEAAVAVGGEVAANEDPALVERFLYVELDKAWLAQTPRAKDAFHEAAALPLHRVAPLYLAWTLTADRAALWEAAKATVTETLAVLGMGQIPGRVRTNLTVWMFGVHALRGFAASVGATLPAGELLGAMKAQLELLLEGSFTEGGHVTRDGFDDFLSDASAMAHSARIQEGVHYKWISGRLFLAVRHIELERGRWRAERGLSALGRGHAALLKIAREKINLHPNSTYVIDVGHQARLEDDRNLRGVLIDPEKVPASLQIDAFPCKTPSSWGGAREGSGRPALAPWKNNSGGNGDSN